MDAVTKSSSRRKYCFSALLFLDILLVGFVAKENIETVLVQRETECPRFFLVSTVS